MHVKVQKSDLEHGFLSSFGTGWCTPIIIFSCLLQNIYWFHMPSPWEITNSIKWLFWILHFHTTSKTYWYRVLSNLHELHGNYKDRYLHDLRGNWFLFTPIFCPVGYSIVNKYNLDRSSATIWLCYLLMTHKFMLQPSILILTILHIQWKELSSVL